MVNQYNFAAVLLPMYYERVTVQNIKSGFERTGIYPFNPDSPDYSKLEAAAAQKESATTIFEAVDQGGYKEMSTQTVAPVAIHKGVQVKQNRVQEFLELAYPLYKSKSKDDDILTVKEFKIMKNIACLCIYLFLLNLHAKSKTIWT